MKFYKTLLISIAFNYLCGNITAQNPIIQWQRTFGGTKDDVAYSTCNTKDGGYMVVGEALSEDGNVTHHFIFGSDDVWLLKLDSLGNLEWNKCYGGYEPDGGHTIVQTFDGGFIFTGFTGSTDGDVTGLHGLGLPDYWVVKIDSTGFIQWQKCLGSTAYDEAYDIIQVADSGYLVTGFVSWNDGDVTGFQGGEDIWVVKLTQNGVKIFAESLGGGGYDDGNSCKQTKDGGYLIAGGTTSNDGIVHGLHGINGDAWVVEINSHGLFKWQKCYGGMEPETANEIILSNDGGFFICSSTNSTDGDVSGLHGSSDYWLIKADSVGTIQWQKCFGGSSIEGARAACAASDGGIVMIGEAFLDNGMVSGTHGGFDFWVCKVDSSGNFEWGKALGGTGDDRPYSIRETPDGGYLAAGYTTSTDGDVTSNHGGKDYWVVKLAPLGLSVPEIENTLMELNIFQINDLLNLRFFSKHNESAQLFLYDVTGKKVFEKNISVNEGINYNSINCSGFAKGMYFVKIDGEKGSLREKVFIQ